MIVTGGKWDAAEALLQILLRSPEIYCDTCGQTFQEGMPQCCEAPLLGTHKSHLKGLIVAIREANKANLNVHGSTKSKSMRACFSMPKKLLYEWERLFNKQYVVHKENDKHKMLLRRYDKKLYREDVRNIMKRFPYLRRCEIV